VAISIMEIAKNALLNNRSAVSTTAKNIANINTEGYTLLRPDLSTSRANFFQSNGLRLEGAVRMRQNYADKQIRHEKQDLGKHRTAELIYSEIEGIFNEPSDTSISNVIADFWDSWTDLANSPESQTARNVVKNRGIILSQTFNQTYDQLNDLSKNLEQDLTDKVNEINLLIGQIGTLNKQIINNTAFNIMDQREQLVLQLAEKISIDVREMDNGNMIVSLNGLILCDNDENHLLTLDTSVDGNRTVVDIKYAESGKNIVINSGEIGALVDIHNNDIPDYQEQLDSIAKALIANTNRIHQTGYNQNGITGKDFFDSSVPNAANFAVSKEILTNSDYIAASVSASAIGDGSIAQQISDLRYDKIVSGSTVNEIYIGMLGDIGNTKQSHTFLNKNQTLVIQNLENQRDAVAGVSLDEEMARLIQYEQGYTAAARLLNTVDEMIDTLLAVV